MTKGQIISKKNCGVLNFSKMQLDIARFSALATKMGQIRKKGTLGTIHLRRRQFFTLF